MLVIHGHQFDYVTKHAKIVSMLGSVMYSWIISLNLFVDRVRRWFGFHKHWSLSSYIKKTVKNAVSFVFGFEKALSTYAEGKNYNSVMCGHIHTSAIKNIGKIKYYNCGDWVESCTAIVETYEGEMKIIKWWDI